MDAPPGLFKQIDVFLLFACQSEEKLKKIDTDASVSIPLDLFISLYRASTKSKFNFFYLDVVNDTFRRNFDKAYDIPEF